MEEYNTNQLTPQRPKGMMFFLILSLINACSKIISSLVSFFVIPTAAKMMETGQLQETYEPIFTMMKWGEDEIDAFLSNLQASLSISPNYHLIQALLFIGSLVGVIMMFKLDKRGFHIYSISQICMLINASVFLYPKQPQSTFFFDLMFTLAFIFLYYTFFKRIELTSFMQNNNSDSATPPEP